jgi:hypothetical protein
MTDEHVKHCPFADPSLPCAPCAVVVFDNTLFGDAQNPEVPAHDVYGRPPSPGSNPSFPFSLPTGGPAPHAPFPPYAPGYGSSPVTSRNASPAHAWRGEGPPPGAGGAPAIDAGYWPAAAPAGPGGPPGAVRLRRPQTADPAAWQRGRGDAPSPGYPNTPNTPITPPILAYYPPGAGGATAAAAGGGYPIDADGWGGGVPPPLPALVRPQSALARAGSHGNSLFEPTLPDQASLLRTGSRGARSLSRSTSGALIPAAALGYQVPFRPASPVVEPVINQVGVQRP